MQNKTLCRLVLAPLALAVIVGCAHMSEQAKQGETQNALVLRSKKLAGGESLKLDGLYYQTAQGVQPITVHFPEMYSKRWDERIKMPDDRIVRIEIQREGDHFQIRMSATPDAGIEKWGLAVDATPDEYFTGLMERVVDGGQQASWAPGRKEAMNLRGQKVDMICKPTTSVYAPYYLSSRGYAMFVKGNWPGFFDFCTSQPDRVKVAWEGPQFELKVYTADKPAALVQAHALDAGPPFLPPRWMFSPWRWRDEHTQRTTYYDGTPVTGPFNSEMMEDLLMMDAFGIPCGVYWIDRPWGPGRLGYDDFEIDYKRLPNFEDSVKYLNRHNAQMVLWIGPFFQGQMETNALKLGYNLAGQPRQPNNYPMVDLSNPKAKAYWQDGVAKLLQKGVGGFKLDRSEENIPENGPYKIFDGRTIRENRNAYPPMYLKATYEVASKYRKDFVLMPRAA